ncbi:MULTISPECIES: ABC transporter permease subunit [unclassified Enterococcus]|uniref:ABC transporter permease subunit n=1 Tax=unclassified Enterococcus TaxID=2608891 RepID=UPI001A92FB82|nr:MULTISPECIES: ABC transporter permease subunit [unclassified Enterococcus]MBO0460825.1 ABC transporter permease subunit [Enterococcus sp. DIV1298c]MBO1299922.1 ABC transporter permease subunit [Enterococcus sp. DIV1271a]
MSRLKVEKLLPPLILFSFALMLFYPLVNVIKEALSVDGRFSFELIQELAKDYGWLDALSNSLIVGGITALLATLLGFVFAYGMHFTNLPKGFKWIIEKCFFLPMLLPTITYGFVLIYSFGRQGLWTRLFGHELFSIYGKSGVVLGLLIYTIPVTFLLMNDAMNYLDKRYLTVSRLMGDGILRGLRITILQPLSKTFGVAFVQAFFMSFTDFGIPVAVGGRETFITTLLYEYFMGSIPDFNRGAVIALIMLVPSIISILFLRKIQKNDHTSPGTSTSIKSNRIRDCLFSIGMTIGGLFIVGVFLVMFLIPFVEGWPFDLTFTTRHIEAFMQTSDLRRTLNTGLIVAFWTALVGTVIAYLAAVFTARSVKQSMILKMIDSLASVTNSIPGMVLGIAYLLVFSGTTLQSTISILVIANMIHYFATPYQLAKSALLKMNPNWENTAKMMGDSWFETLVRIILPNSKRTIVEMACYYFTNSMVTISAVVFLTSARTMVITTKIKELQHFGRFTEIFILSILLLLVNLTARILAQSIMRRVEANEKISKKRFDLSVIRQRFGNSRGV